jgi:hypothetical protein
MSGYKKATITIDEAEYLRLFDAEKELNLSSKDSERVQRQNKALRQELEENLRQIEKKQADYHSLVEDYNQQIGYIEEKAEQVMEANHRELLDVMDSYTSVVDAEYSAITESQSALLQDQLDREDSYRREILGYLRENMDNSRTRQQEKLRVIQDWVAAAAQLLNYLQVNYTVTEKELPRLKKAQNTLKNLNDAYIEMFPDAAFLQAQETYQTLATIRSTLDKRQVQLALLRTEIRQELEELLRLFDVNQSTLALNRKGETTRVKIDVNHWTEGGYDRAKVDAANLHQLLFQQNPPATVEDLTRILQETIPILRETLTNLVQKARLEVIRSQLRYSIATTFFTSLSEQGYRLSENGYLDADQRKSFTIRLVNTSGDEVDILISPNYTQELANDFQMVTSAREMITEHEMKARVKEIQRSLEQHGLKVKDFSAAIQPPPSVNLTGGMEETRKKLGKEG